MGKTHGSLDQRDVLDFWVKMLRGAWFGIYRGFYRETKHAPDRCLSRNLEEEIL